MQMRAKIDRQKITTGHVDQNKKSFSKDLLSKSLVFAVILKLYKLNKLLTQID